jgi:two-component system, NtrC family, nitrogen regulation sensor histidine kinase NtrY
MKKLFKRKFVFSATAGFLLWALGFYLYHYELKYRINENDVKEFELAFQEKCASLEATLKEFLVGIENRETETERIEFAEGLADKTKIQFFIYDNDSLTLWTSNRVPISSVRDTNIADGNIVLLPNGWYKFEHIVAGDRLYVASMLIKHEYYHENEDLINTFSSHLLPNFKGNLNVEDVGYPVHNKYGKRIFSIAPLDEDEKNVYLELTIFFCYLVAFLILVQLLINAFQRLLIARPIILVIFPAAIVALRYAWLKSGWLGPFEKFELFSPELFASETVPSLGDLIINVSIFYLLIHFLLKRTRNWFKEGRKRLKLVVFVVPLFFLSFLVAFEINSTIKVLVNDSQIKFDLERLFDLNVYSFVSIALIGAVFFTYFRMIQYIIIQFKKSEFEWNRLAFLWVLTSLVYAAIDQVISDHSILTSFWPVFMSGSLLWFQYRETEYKFIHVISILAFVAFYAAFILKEYTDNRENEIRKSLAEFIADDRDETAEFDHYEVEEELRQNNFLVPYFEGKFNQKKLQAELESGPFRRLADKYDLTFYLFRKDRQMVEDFKNYEMKDYNSLVQVIRDSGPHLDSVDHLYYIKNYTQKLTYISHFTVIANDSLYGHLFTEMQSKKFPEDVGLPSLLLDEPAKFSDQLKNYSIAKYVEDKLVNHKGEFSYPLKAAAPFDAKQGFRIIDGYSHYFLQSEAGHKTILSRKLSSGFALFTSFSYLLIIFGVLLLFPLGYKQLQSEISFRNIKFNVKIQTVLIGLILVSLISFGIGAGTFVERQHHESNIGLIKEKMESVKMELENKLREEKILRVELADYLEFLLKKFSRIFFTDMNLYTIEGDLLASSQPDIYTKGLVSRKMEPDAYLQVHWKQKSVFVQQERIGKLRYLSGYSPVFNKRGDLLAYLNVQYISKQDELEQQISNFLLAIINIMVLMLALSTILAITISNRLTRPLKYIQDSLRNVQIGSLSKPIQYSGSDEIGELVKEYNKKVEELQVNAEQLARSERESAWREMAKQVAHEIKNPLTPMKLSIQHLKRSVNFADEESKEKLDRVTKSLIEQIDALTQIANEFSNFAKMPKANEYKVDLADILRNSAAVFEDEEEHDFIFNVDPKMSAMIWADKDLLLRVFNNLFTNALQAIRNAEAETNERGVVEVNLEEAADYYIVRVRDNGVGIPEAEKDKIFVPYFTTKSTGTGLGLAMSKQIVENLNGKIWFESEVGVGTTFFVSFNKMKP